MIKIDIINGSEFRNAIKKCEKQIKQSIRKSLYESATEVKNEIKKTMREPKSGVLKPKALQRYTASPLRRSAIGEGLARETGYAERRIASTRPLANSVDVGFKSDLHFDYVRYWEFRGRPTLSISFERSRYAIDTIFRRNFNKII